MFQCLQENIAQPAFGAECRAEVENRTSSMQEDYRLDYSLSSSCEHDVSRLCAQEQVRSLGAPMDFEPSGSLNSEFVKRLAVPAPYSALMFCCACDVSFNDASLQYMHNRFLRHAYQPVYSVKKAGKAEVSIPIPKPATAVS